MDKKLKDFLLKILLFATVSCIITFPLIFKMNSGIYGDFFTTDIRGGVGFLWWQKYAFTHSLNENLCTFVSFPFSNDLTQSSLFWMPSLILKWLTILTSPIFCLNLLTILSFTLAGFFTYLLIHQLTNNKTIALLGGFIFAFSPFHLNKVMEFSFFSEGNWIALYLYSLWKLKEKTDKKTILFAGISFGLLLNFNAYYGIFSFIFTAWFLIFSFFYHWQIKLHEFKNPEKRILLRKRISFELRFLIAIASFFMIAAIINLPTLINLYKNISNPNIDYIKKTALGYVRSFDYLFSQSARPLSYLLPASTHPVFGEFTKNMFGSFFYGRGSIEQTLYLGWMPLILSFLAFKQWKYRRLHPAQYPDYQDSKENFYIGFFIFSAICAFIFSMPPYFDLCLFKIYFPSYFIYKVLPMFRAYARFGVIVMLCVSVLAGFGLKHILEKIKTKKIKIITVFLIFSIIIFEFTNFPPFRVTDLSNVPQVYSWLKKEKGDFVIVEYPIGIGSAGEAQENYDYLYYQTVHEKRLVNGASIGTKAFEFKKKILRADNLETARILKGIGVKYLIFHSDLYKNGEYKDSSEVIGEIPKLGPNNGYKLFKTFENDLVYEIIAEPADFK